MNTKTSFKNWLTKANVIKERCQPFLNMTDMPLYRGVSTSLLADGLGINSFFKAKTETVRKDRKPRDSTLISHKLMDQWFFEKFGIRPRSQGIFCSGDKSLTKQYGKTAYVFPVGKFQYIWGVEENNRHPLRDTLDLSRGISDQMRVKPASAGPEVTDRYMSTVQWYVNEQMEDAQHTGAEIVILCDEVILVPIERVQNYTDFIRSL